MNKLATVNVQGGEYATVPTRLKAFRETHPRAVVETNPTFNEDGQIVFKATITADKSDPDSPSATGHSFGPNKGAKAFEKLETVAVGRALSLLGYLNNGEIASTEELEDFYDFQFDKVEKQINEAKTVEDLLSIYKDMNSAAKKQFTEKLGEKRKELENAKSTAKV